MGTFLFKEIIFGPVISRRLGVSLGVNLLPIDGKVCSFDCIYCECGLNSERRSSTSLPTSKEVISQLEIKLKMMVKEGKLPDVITFAGNGEPTIHPEFASIIDATNLLRDSLCPDARVAVLTNSTMVDRVEVFNALLAVDDNIVKLDSAIDSTVELIDNPKSKRGISYTIDALSKFKGECIVQTMFLRGVVEGKVIDNTTDVEVKAWIEALRVIAPKRVMIYSIDRDTPIEELEKVNREELDAIAEIVKLSLNIDVEVSG